MHSVLVSVQQNEEQTIIVKTKIISLRFYSNIKILETTTNSFVFTQISPDVTLHLQFKLEHALL